MKTDNKYEMFESVQEEKIKFIAKILKRTWMLKQYQEKQREVLNAFWKTYKHSRMFKKAIDDLPPGEYPLTEIIRERLVDCVGKGNYPNLKKLQAIFRALGPLVSEYETDFIITKSEDGKCGYFPSHGRFPHHALFKVKGREAEFLGFTDDLYDENQDKLIERLIELKCIFDEIEIDDLTPLREERSKHEIIQAIQNMSRLTPTIVKYINRRGARTLLISIPENLDPTTFFNEYKKAISWIHKDFYKKTFLGRPKDKDKIKNAILTVLEEYKGKRFPITTMCEIAGEKLLKEMGIKRKPATIRRWYHKEVKAIKETKNIN